MWSKTRRKNLANFPIYSRTPPPPAPPKTNQTKQNKTKRRLKTPPPQKKQNKNKTKTNKEKQNKTKEQNKRTKNSNEICSRHPGVLWWSDFLAYDFCQHLSTLRKMNVYSFVSRWNGFELLRSTTQSDFIVRQKNKCPSSVSYTTMNNKDIFNDFEYLAHTSIAARQFPSWSSIAKHTYYQCLCFSSYFNQTGSLLLGFNWCTSGIFKIDKSLLTATSSE